MRRQIIRLSVRQTAKVLAILYAAMGLLLVPIFVVLARLTAGRVGERLYLLPAIGVQAVFLLTFLNNVWVS